MVDYVEFPVDLLRRVVLPKKKDDGGGPPPPEPNPYPCGMWTSWDAFGEVFSLQSDGPFGLRSGYVDSFGNPAAVWNYLPHLDAAQSLPTNLIDYLWFQPTSWTVTAINLLGIGSELVLWRNVDPLTFNVCTDVPFVRSSGTIEVLPQQPTEQFPPLLYFVQIEREPINCSGTIGRVTIQAHCDLETDGGLPPQPPGAPFPGPFTKPVTG